MSVKDFYPTIDPVFGSDFSITKQIPPNLQYSRASTGTYVGPDGLIKTALVGEPRFDYDPLTGEVKGLLVEEARTNYMYPSGGFGLNWNMNTFVTSTTGQTAVDGSNDAVLWKETIDNGQHRLLTSAPYLTPDNNSIYTLSFYAKSFGGKKRFIVTHEAVSATFGNGCIYNLDSFEVVPNFGVRPNGSYATTASMQALPNGWTRIELSAFSGISAGFRPMIRFLQDDSGSDSYVGDPAKGFYFWGFQIEKSSSATSYIPTTTTAVTRAADTLSPIILPTSNSSTILVETESQVNNIPILSLNDGTTTNEIKLISHPLAGGSSIIEDEEAITTSVGGSRLYKTTTAVSIDTDQIQVVSDNAVSGITTISSTELNQISLNGIIKKLYVYDQPFSPLVLRGLTTQSKTTPFPPSTEPNLTLGVAIESPNTTWNLRSTGTVNYDVDWGDGQIETTQTSNTKAHTYVSPGIYKVVVKIRSGVFRPFYNNNIDAERIVSIFSTGTGWTFGTSLDGAWYRGFNVVFVDEELNTSTVTNFNNAWRDCRSLLSFPLINTAAGTNFIAAWFNCSSLTTFPLLDTSASINFTATWQSCSSLTSFPLINTAAGTNFSVAWYNCSSLTSFPLIDTTSGTNFFAAWLDCSSLTSFPLINTAAGTSFIQAWQNCSSLTSFPLINTALGTNFSVAWYNCSSLTSFPALDTAAGTNFSRSWQSCSSLTSFPALDTAAGTNFSRSWQSCSSLTSFPLINTAAGTNFFAAWTVCSSLTSFPALDFDAAVGLATVNLVGFQSAWENCTQLADFPPNLFNNTVATRYLNAFLNCALTAQSIENILVSINTANTSNGTLTLSGGTNATKTTWTTAANTAYDALIARGWTITFRA